MVFVRNNYSNSYKSLNIGLNTWKELKKCQIISISILGAQKMAGVGPTVKGRDTTKFLALFNRKTYSN